MVMLETESCLLYALKIIGGKVAREERVRLVVYNHQGRRRLIYKLSPIKLIVGISPRGQPSQHS